MRYHEIDEAYRRQEREAHDRMKAMERRRQARAIKRKQDAQHRADVQACIDKLGQGEAL